MLESEFCYERNISCLLKQRQFSKSGDNIMHGISYVENSYTALVMTD